AEAMYRSTLHWRPLLNGYSSYWPAGFHERMEATALLLTPSVLKTFVCDTGLRSILVDVRVPFPGRDAWLRAHAAPLPGLRLAATTPEFLVFDVTFASDHPDGVDCRPQPS